MAPEETERLTAALSALAAALLTEKTLKADLERLARLAVDLVADCSSASFTVLVDGEPTSLGVADRVALEIDMVQYDGGDGPCLAALNGDSIRIGFIPHDDQFPHFAIGAADRRVLSVLSTPVIDHGTVLGSLNMYSRTAESFADQATHDTAAVLAAEAANAIIKSTFLDRARATRDQMQADHDEASQVARAQGVLMAIHDTSAAQALNLIRSAASDNGDRLIVIAERILATVRNEDDTAPTGD
jgi:GAF domain-containing protein